MKNINKNDNDSDEMRPEYDFSNSKPNKYSALLKRQERLIKLEADVYKVFDTDEKVNNALRAFIRAIPKESLKKLQKA